MRGVILPRNNGMPECDELPTKEDYVADPKEDELVKSVENLLAEKQAIAAREKKLIEDLNAVLGKMGYRVVSTKSGVHTGAGTGNKPGRPPGSGKGQPKAAPSS
jgi:hypothetical protein